MYISFFLGKRVWESVTWFGTVNGDCCRVRDVCVTRRNWSSEGISTTAHQRQRGCTLKSGIPDGVDAITPYHGDQDFHVGVFLLELLQPFGNLPEDDADSNLVFRHSNADCNPNLFNSLASDSQSHTVRSSYGSMPRNRAPSKM